jgi:Icc-related predicted phosphoesterase
MIRVAAVGDLHLADDDAAPWRNALADVSERADLLLLAGDLTRVGALAEGRAVLAALASVSIPVLAVLGNHDHHASRVPELCALLEDGGVQVLEGTAATLELKRVRVGVAGAKGFGGGFLNACASDFGEPEMKAFVEHTRRSSERLAGALASLDADVRLALLHYAPVPATLAGERLEIYPFLGSYLLAEAVDRGGADLVLHGHAHAGSEKGVTPGGVRVRNVAQPVIRSAYRVYCLAGDATPIDCTGPESA